MYDRYGPRPCIAVGAVLSLGGYVFDGAPAARHKGTLYIVPLAHRIRKPQINVCSRSAQFAPGSHHAPKRPAQHVLLSVASRPGLSSAHLTFISMHLLFNSTGGPAQQQAQAQDCTHKFISFALIPLPLGMALFCAIFTCHRYLLMWAAAGKMINYSVGLMSLYAFLWSHGSSW